MMFVSSLTRRQHGFSPRAAAMLDAILPRGAASGSHPTTIPALPSTESSGGRPMLKPAALTPSTFTMPARTPGNCSVLSTSMVARRAKSELFGVEYIYGGKKGE